LQVTDADESSTVKPTETERELVNAATAPSETTGAVASTVHDRLAEPTFPAASVAVTTSVCAPSASAEAWNGLAHETAAPESSLQVTDADESSTVKPTETERELDSAATASSETTGAVPSTVQERVARATLPTASVARTTSV
jgi:hypothetical protein